MKMDEETDREARRLYIRALLTAGLDRESRRRFQRSLGLSAEADQPR